MTEQDLCIEQDDLQVNLKYPEKKKINILLESRLELIIRKATILFHSNMSHLRSETFCS